MSDLRSLAGARLLWPASADNAQIWPEAILRGQILQLYRDDARLLADYVWQQLSQAFAGLPLPDLHLHLDNADLQQRLALFRTGLRQDQVLQQHYLRLLRGLGVDPAQIPVDFPRLRAIIPGAETIPAAAAVYYAHRDTWYANPAGQINLWLPLSAYRAPQTFVFWPAAFGQPVANDSDQFDYQVWKSETGFQAQSASAGAYPQAPQPPGAALGFDCQAGEVLLFAAAHLHQTRVNPGPQIRYSLDLRWVWPHATAPDPDNASRGSTLAEYVYLHESPLTGGE